MQCQLNDTSIHRGARDLAECGRSKQSGRVRELHVIGGVEEVGAEFEIGGLRWANEYRYLRQVNNLELAVAETLVQSFKSFVRCFKSIML